MADYITQIYFVQCCKWVGKGGPAGEPVQPEPLNETLLELTRTYAVLVFFAASHLC